MPPCLCAKKELKAARAFTIAELLIALTITAIISASIAAMISSVSAGTTGQQDGRRFLVRVQSLEARLATSVHASQCILASGNNYIVYWIADSTHDNAVQLSELGMLELDPVTNTLNQYQTVFPSNYSLAQIASANTTFAANTNWYNAAQAAKSTFFTPTPIAGHITAFTPTLDAANPTSAHTATFAITISDGIVTRNAVIGATLRNQVPPQ